MSMEIVGQAQTAITAVGYTRESITFVMFLIFTGTAVLSTVALYARQSLLVAYIILGMILGHFGLSMVNDAELIKQIGDIGIIFLLFLLGLSLNPFELIKMLGEMSWIALFSSLIFGVVGFVVAYLFGVSIYGSVIVGVAMMFSSTIVGLKLLPTTVLHHRHTGEVMISLLLLQDVIAIFVLMILQLIQEGHQGLWLRMGGLFFGFPFLLCFAYLFQKFVLLKLFTRFDSFREYIFLLSIGWCLAMAQAATMVGLSPEIGAFIGGVSIATHPISQFISENLRPLRDFFLVMFFFTVGAQFNLPNVGSVILPALVLSALMMLVKPYTFRFLLQRAGETKGVAWEVGVRLAQASEFSLLIAYLASSMGFVGHHNGHGSEAALQGLNASDLIQAVTIITFVLSTYWVVFRFPSPIAMSDRLRMD